MKLFISQPMKGKTLEEIVAERHKAIEVVQATYNEDIEVIDSFFRNAPQEARPLRFLAKSIELMSTADLVYFCKGWENYRGCVIEHECAQRYGLTIRYETIPELLNRHRHIGLTDKNDRMIFEGDIVFNINRPLRDDGFGVVRYCVEDAKFMIEFNTFIVGFDVYDSKYLEIVGNIYNNPELINWKK